MKSICANVAYLHKKSGLSTIDHANALDLDRTALSRVINGKRLPTLTQLTVIARHYDLTLDVFLRDPREFKHVVDKQSPIDGLPAPAPVKGAWSAIQKFDKTYLRMHEPHVFYFYSPNVQKIYGYPFSFKKPTGVGIPIFFNSSKAKEPDYLGYAYSVSSYLYFYAWPTDALNELVFAIFNPDYSEGYLSGYVLATQRNQEGTGDYTFSSFAMLVAGTGTTGQNTEDQLLPPARRYFSERYPDLFTPLKPRTAIKKAR